MSYYCEIGIYIINARKGRKRKKSDEIPNMLTPLQNQLSESSVKKKINLPTLPELRNMDEKSKSDLVDIVLKMEKICFKEEGNQQAIAERETRRLVESVFSAGNDTELLFLVLIRGEDDPNTIIDGGMATVQYANHTDRKRLWINEVCRASTRSSRENWSDDLQSFSKMINPVTLTFNILHQYLEKIRIPNKNKEFTSSRFLKQFPSSSLMVEKLLNEEYAAVKPAKKKRKRNTKLEDYYNTKYDYHPVGEDKHYTYMEKPLKKTRVAGGKKKTRKHKKTRPKKTKSWCRQWCCKCDKTRKCKTWKCKCKRKNRTKKGGSYGELSKSALKKMASYARREKTRRAKQRKLRWSKGLTRRGKPRYKRKTKIKMSGGTRDIDIKELMNAAGPPTGDNKQRVPSTNNINSYDGKGKLMGTSEEGEKALEALRDALDGNLDLEEAGLIGELIQLDNEPDLDDEEYNARKREILTRAGFNNFNDYSNLHKLYSEAYELSKLTLADHEDDPIDKVTVSVKQQDGTVKENVYIPTKYD